MFVVAAAHVPLAAAYYARLWSLPHYQFYPLALVAAFVLARRDYRVVVGRDSAVDRRGAMALLFVGLSLLAAAVVLDSPWLAVVAVLASGGAMLVELGGLALLRAEFPAALMVLITLRPPMGYDDRLIKLLQTATARSASALLDVLGVVHALAGNVIEIPGRRLMVEEACSGVNSFFSATACVLFYVLWTRRGWISSLLLFLSIPFWVVFANTLRVVAVTCLRAGWNIAADEGMLHDALGLAVFLVAVGLIISTERLLNFYGSILKQEPSAGVPNAAAAATMRSANAAGRLPSRGWMLAGGAAVLLCLLQLPGLLQRVRHFSDEWRAPAFAEFGEDWIAESMGPWQRVRFETVQRDRTSPLGGHSQTWSLAGTGSRGALSFDYPFLGWHELTECYEAQGWRLEQRSIVEGSSEGESQPLVEAQFRNDQTGRSGRLYFSLATRDGRPFPIRTRGELDEWLDRAAARMRELTSFSTLSKTMTLDDRATYQIQFFVESYEPLDEPTAAAARKAFVGFRRQAVERLATESQKS